MQLQSIIRSARAFVSRRLSNRLYNIIYRAVSSIRLHFPSTLEDIKSTSRGPEERNASFATTAPLQSAPPYTVVIAVYNAVEDVAKCLESVACHASADQTVVVVDDASPDPRVKRLLSQFLARTGWAIVENTSNQGYTKSINTGIQEAGENDVIILNSDTIVTPNWAQRLRFAAYSAADIATVTPVSNNAGAFSVPIAGQANERPPALTLDEYARAISQELRRASINTPTGNGFCMYIRRDALAQLGAFDEEAFPNGYGEENDFGMRAVASGRRNIIDFSTYVYHKRSASFGDAKAELLAHGRRIVDERYPAYTRAVRALGKNPAAATYRTRIAEIAFQVDKPKPRILFVISTVTGGTPQTNADLMRGLSDDFECWLLRCDSKQLELSRMVAGSIIGVEKVSLSMAIRPMPHRSEEYDRIVLDYLHRYAIELIHIRHIGWHSLGLIEIAKANGLPVVFSFHDFYTVCPSIKLLDENWAYCAGSCTGTPGECRVELWDQRHIPNLKGNNVHAWRRAMSDVLKKCDEFVTTSIGARDTLIDNFPWLSDRSFHVIPHGRDIPMAALNPGLPRLTEPLRVLVLGNINEAKGGVIYRNIATLYPSWDIEFHFLGNWKGPRVEDRRYIYHGAYDRGDIVNRIADIRPHCAAILSIWPETYCHTLTECWSSGIPVFAFDIGAVGERIRTNGGGWSIDCFDATSFRTAIETARQDLATWKLKIDEIQKWHADPMHNPSTAAMTASYRKIYASHMQCALMALE